MAAPDAYVASPCVRKCCLDDDDICMGCGRSIREIIGWNTASATERLDIIARSRLRVQSRPDPFADPS